MIKKCNNCGAHIELRYILKSKNKIIRCPECNIKLEPTNLSKLVFSVTLILPLLVINYYFIGKVIVSLLVSLAWILLSIFFLQPMIYYYEHIKNN